MQSFAAPLIILILAGFVFGYYFFQKTTENMNLASPAVFEEKTNLSEYKNINLGFKFFFSQGLEVQEDSEEEFDKRGKGKFRKNFKGYIGYEPAKVLGVVVVLDETKSYEINPLTIWVFENSDNLSIEKWYENFWYYPFVWGDYTARRNTVAPNKDSTISGQLAKSGVVVYRPGEPRFIYLSRNGKMYLLRVIGEKGDQILSTFKFLK